MTHRFIFSAFSIIFYDFSPQEAVMIYLSLGSNLGNKIINLQNAITELENMFFTKLHKTPIYETRAIQPDETLNPLWDKNFFNMVVYGQSDVSPENLLAGIKHIEEKMGRDLQAPRWSPRIIDIDILYFNDVKMNTSQLTIPHSAIAQRPFLHNLLQLAGKFDFPFEKNAFLNSFAIEPKLVAIVNVTSDSFSDGGDFLEYNNAINYIDSVYNFGASVIEIGGQSTRPGCVLVSQDEEWERIHATLQHAGEKYFGMIGVDTFYDYVAEMAMDCGNLFWLNNVYSNFSNSVLEKIAEKNIKIVYMYSGNLDMITWASVTVHHLQKFGIKLENIILDPGIGFGKNLVDNIKYIKISNMLKKFGCKIMVGHSRKSFMQILSNSNRKNLDMQTIAVSNFLHDLDIDYLRVHNIDDHMKFFTAKQCFEKKDFIN